MTGETPTVAIQATTRQRVLDQTAIDSLPTGRSCHSMANLIPGLTSSTNGDAGGSRNDLTLTFAVHGLSGNDSRPYVSGLRLSIPGSSGANNTTLPNTAAIQEVVVDYGAISAEQGPGGVRINMIPKEGGNRFTGIFVGNYATESWQSNNFTQDLKDRGPVDARFHQVELGHQPGHRRPDQAGQTVVLHVRAVQRRSRITWAACSTT